MRSPKPKIVYEGKTLIIEWDNRDITKCIFTTVFVSAFGLVWVPITFYTTYLLFSSEAQYWLLRSFGLLFCYVGVIAIVLAWWIRRTIERVEIGDEYYLHTFTNCPQWFTKCHTKQWPAHEIIDIVLIQTEVRSSLDVWRRNGRHDMVAYWANDDFRRLVFDVIQRHLETIGSQIEACRKRGDARYSS